MKKPETVFVERIEGSLFPYVVDFFGREALEQLGSILDWGNRYHRQEQFQNWDRVIAMLAQGVDTLYDGWHQDGKRAIHSPQGILRRIQNSLLRCFQNLYRYRRNSTSYGLGSSEIDCVVKHRFSDYQLGLDLANAFHQITPPRINEAVDGAFSKLLLYLMTVDKKIVDGEKKCFERLYFEVLPDEERFAKRVLPQGGPNSSFIFELCLQPLDEKLARVAKKHDLLITRYVDNIQVTSSKPIGIKIHREVERAIEEDFKLNKKKTRKLGRKSMANPLRMLGLIILPEGRIRIRRDRSKKFEAVFHRAIIELMKDPYSPRTKQKVLEADGIIGYLEELRHKPGGEISPRLAKKIHSYKRTKKVSG